MDEKYVFISYKAEDYDRAKAIKDHLERNAIPCWMAPMSIRGGKSYAQEIPPAIQKCCIFLLILSDKAQQSKWVPREVDQAINRDKIIMPYMLENCPLRSDFSFYLTNVQGYEAFRDPEETLKRMTRDIQNALGITPPPPAEIPETQPKAEIPEKHPAKEAPKQKAPKKEKKPAAGKKKKLPFILGGVLAVLLVIVLAAVLLPGKVTISGVDFKEDAYSVQLENVTLTQKDVDQFTEFSSLSFIRLENCVIEAQDLNPFATESLLTLTLENCDITNGQFATIDFSGIHHFSELLINGNPRLTSLANLNVCTGTLNTLDISDTGIRSFDWLTDFTKLVTLRADRIGLWDTTLLEPLIYLEELSLSGNEIGSLEGLKNTSKLSVVDLSHNILTDVSVLSRSADCLTVVHLEYNALTNLDFLAEASGLEKVYVDANQLTSLDWLEGKTELQVLSASQNSIQSISGLGIGEKMRYLNLSHNQLQAIEEGDLSFAEDNYLMVDLCGNDLQTLQLPQNCSYKHLALLDNPNLDITSVNALKGWNVYFDFPADMTVQTLKELPFTALCIVGCPLDRQVEIEEGLSTEKLMTEEEALEEIAKGAEDASY